MPRFAYSRNMIRNLLAADISHETTYPPDIPHGSSSTNSNQPEKFLVDGSVNLESRRKKSRSESDNLSSPAESDPSQIFNLSSERRARMRYLQINMVPVMSKSALSVVLFISFGINENTQTRISITAQNALRIQGQRAKKERINVGQRKRTIKALRLLQRPLYISNQVS